MTFPLATSLVAVSNGAGAKPLTVYVCDEHRQELQDAGFLNASRTSTNTLACGLCVADRLRNAPSERDEQGSQNQGART